jgi:D-3-phosphoglycerate dehydrogenase
MTVRPLVHVTQPIDDGALERLAAECTVALGYGPHAQRLDQVVDRVEGIVVRRALIEADAIAAAPRLKVIARAGAGYDNIDVAAATDRDVVVCNVPGSNTVAVAEHVFALLLAVRRNVARGDSFVRTGRFDERDDLTGEELSTGRLGIVGFGRIGAHVARIARAGFGMEVMAYDPLLSADAVRAGGAEPVAGLEELLGRVDTLSIHVPLTPATRGLIGGAELDLLPRGAVLIHTSRGGVVDEAALLPRLRSGALGGAGIDVFEQEPVPPDHPLCGLDNVVLAPHLAGQTSASMGRMAMGAVEAVTAVLRGERPQHLVNAEVWGRGRADSGVGPGAAGR